MPSNRSVDPQLIQQALQPGGVKTKAATDDTAQPKCIDRRGQKDVLDLAGKLGWDAAYSYKKERSRR